MRATGIVLGLIGASLSCASEPAGPGIADGSPSADSGASSEAGPSCPPAGERAYATLEDADGETVYVDMNEVVTVTASESCTAMTCPYLFHEKATRIALTAADGGQWSLYLRYDLPAGLLSIGDRFDLTVEGERPTNFGEHTQTVVLSREGQLVLFSAGLARFGEPPLPRLEAFGIRMSDNGPTCQGGNVRYCFFSSHAVRVTVGEDSAVVAGGQTYRIGWLSLSGGSTQYFNRDSCDRPSSTGMVGHRAP